MLRDFYITGLDKEEISRKWFSSLLHSSFIIMFWFHSSSPERDIKNNKWLNILTVTEDQESGVNFDCSNDQVKESLCSVFFSSKIKNKSKDSNLGGRRNNSTVKISVYIDECGARNDLEDYLIL